MITINGKTYIGSNISVKNNKIFIDGKLVEDYEAADKIIVEVKIEGDPISVESDAAVTVEGSVQGSVRAGNYVSCHQVGGNVDAGNYVACGNVAGNVKAGNYVNRR